MVSIGIIIGLSFLSMKVSQRPHVLLITIDALRADHLSCYGYERETTPHIDLFARKGVLFSQCYATSSYTASATPGLLTGRYLMPSRPAEALVPLSKQFTTLAEYLKDAGYFTVGLVTNGKYMGSTGYERGFDFYPSSPKYFPEMREDFIQIESEGGGTHEQSPGSVKFTKQILWIVRVLKEAPLNKPFFLWIHYIDPHAPYTPPEEYLEFFKGDALWQKETTQLSLSPHGGSSAHLSGGRIPRFAFQEGHSSLNYYKACYDAEIRLVDFHLDRLLRELPSNTLVIITADHGESLGEHNTYFSHGENIYDELLHIPLIIKSPRSFKGGSKVSVPVSAVDIVPTILKELRPVWYFFHQRRFDGIPLQRFLSGASGDDRPYIYSYGSGQWSIRDTAANIKYSIDNTGQEELYKIPDENRNLSNSPEMSAIKRSLKSRLAQWLQKYPVCSDAAQKMPVVDTVVKENLKSLGYLH